MFETCHGTFADLAEMRDYYRRHCPANTKFKCVGVGYKEWIMLKFSPYTIGPVVVTKVSGQ